MLERFKLLLLLLSVAACTSENDIAAAKAYPLMSLFEASKSLDGDRVEVVGYFSQLDGDIPVLYVDIYSIKEKDALYRSHILFKEEIDNANLQSIEEQICFIKATIWYRGTVPTLDQAEIVRCRG